MIRRSNTIKATSIKFVHINTVIYILLGIIVIFIGFTLAQTIHIASIDRGTRALHREIVALRAEQEYLKAQFEGQAIQTTPKEAPYPSRPKQGRELARISTTRGMLHIYYSMPLLTLQGGEI